MPYLFGHFSYDFPVIFLGCCGCPIWSNNYCKAAALLVYDKESYVTQKQGLSIWQHPINFGLHGHSANLHYWGPSVLVRNFVRFWVQQWHCQGLYTGSIGALQGLYGQKHPEKTCIFFVLFTIIGIFSRITSLTLLINIIFC